MHAHLQHKQRIHFFYNREIQNFLSRKTSEKRRLQNVYRISYILCRELPQQTFYWKTGQIHRPSNEPDVEVKAKKSVLSCRTNLASLVLLVFQTNLKYNFPRPLKFLLTECDISGMPLRQGWCTLVYKEKHFPVCWECHKQCNHLQHIQSTALKLALERRHAGTVLPHTSLHLLQVYLNNWGTYFQV
jgi:hypothetical protein